MSVRDAILTTQPTSYWPLDDLSGSSSCHDEMGLHDASLPSAWRHAFQSFPSGRRGAVFRRRIGEHLNHPRRSAILATFLRGADCRRLALSPRAQQCERGRRTQDKYVHYVEKAVAEFWSTPSGRSDSTIS